MDFLSLIAYRDAIRPSDVMRELIERAIETEKELPDDDAAKKTHIVWRLTEKQLAYLNEQARRLGIPRSDVARRIVDTAAALFFGG
jgi:hypothetical protein